MQSVKSMRLVRCRRAAGWGAVAARRAALSSSVRSASSSPLTDVHPLASSAHLWEAAMNDFYAAFCLSTRQTPQHPQRQRLVPVPAPLCFLAASASSLSASLDVERLTHAAAVAMQRCLDVGRASEALEVYRIVCCSGLINISITSMSSAAATPTQRTTTTAAAAVLPLDELARRALDAVPHHRCQHSMLALLMAAEQDTLPATATERAREVRGAPPLSIVHPSTSTAQRHVAAAATSVWATAELDNVRPLSAVEQARIRIYQRLHTLHSTQQLRRPLGRECCLVEMLSLTTPSRGAPSTAATEMEPAPLRTLSRIILLHPFTHATPTATSAQQELLWEEVGTSAGAALGLGAADAARLAAVDEAVRPYRRLCRSSLDFMAQFVPDWDAVLVRRVAERLVLPAAAHNVFPETYRRSRSSGTGARGSGAGALLTAAAEAPTVGGAASGCTSWTDSAAHHLFPTCDVSATSGASCGGDLEDHTEGTRVLSPMQRVECIVRRRVHHDVVVPDTAYVLQRLHQLKQLARHREVVITHRVFLDLVAAAAASLPAHPTRFHARRILHEIMQVTTTARTAASTAAAISASALGDGEWPTTSRSARRRSQHGVLCAGFTLLGLQDELALLEHCAERFFLAEGQLPEEATSDWALMGEYHHPARLTATVASTTTTMPEAATAPRSPHDGSSMSVVLVAKQLERMIAAHDRGEAFPAVPGPAGDAGACCSAQPNVDALVQHILGDYSGAAAVADSPAPLPCLPASRLSGDTLFRNRSRGRWARLPMLVATTQDRTRAAAFAIGLSMHPPAGVVA